MSVCDSGLCTLVSWAQWVSSGSGPRGQLLGQFPQPIAQPPCLARPQHFFFFSPPLPSAPASLSSNRKAHKAAFLVGPPEATTGISPWSPSLQAFACAVPSVGA